MAPVSSLMIIIELPTPVALIPSMTVVIPVPASNASDSGLTVGSPF